MSLPNKPASWKVSRVSRWRPVKLYQKNPSPKANGFDEPRYLFIGWFSAPKVYLVKNINEGWIAFLEDQTDEKLNTCPCCSRRFDESVSISEHTK